MKDWKKILISPDSQIIDALRIISEEGLQIALVVDENRKLLGTVTDGDVREGLLAGRELQEPVERIMWAEPTVARGQDSPGTVLEIMKRNDVLQIPLVDEKGSVIGLSLLKDLIKAPERENSVVLMAGGLGTRLGPLTEECPKPLLRIGKKPILETILCSFIKNGFRKFYLSVNYLAEMIENYFQDGSKWGVQIEYLREDKRLGTAGALSLVPSKPSVPFFVMNGDILTNVDFGRIMDFHTENKSDATMCVREYDFQVPYGVVHTEGNRLRTIEEKPVHTFFVNAGIYVLNPSCLDLIPGDEFFDMTQLFEKLSGAERKATVYPVREYWLDIGRMEDLKRADGEYCKYFIPKEGDA